MRCWPDRLTRIDGVSAHSNLERLVFDSIEFSVIFQSFLVKVPTCSAINSSFYSSLYLSFYSSRYSSFLPAHHSTYHSIYNLSFVLYEELLRSTLHELSLFSIFYFICT